MFFDYVMCYNVMNVLLIYFQCFDIVSLHQKEHLACKVIMYTVLALLSVLSEVQIICILRGYSI